MARFTKRVTHAIVAIADDGIIKEDMAIGFGVEQKDGSVELILRAVPVHGTKMYLTPLPEEPAYVAQAAIEYRKERSRSERLR